MQCVDNHFRSSSDTANPLSWPLAPNQFPSNKPYRSSAVARKINSGHSKERQSELINALWTRCSRKFLQRIKYAVHSSYLKFICMVFLNRFIQYVIVKTLLKSVDCRKENWIYWSNGRTIRTLQTLNGRFTTIFIVVQCSELPVTKL